MTTLSNITPSRLMPDRSIKTLALSIAATLTLAVISTGAAQAASNDFKIDSRYSQGPDLLAKIPTKRSQQLDPSVLVFAYTPVEDPAVYKDVWARFLQHMERVTGKKVRFYPVQSNAAQLEAMRAGRLHIAGINTGSVPLAVACAGFRPFTMMASKNGDYGYEMEIITQPNSGINKIEDLRGKKVAFTSETSNSGFKAPSAILNAKFNMIPGRDFKSVFSGKHDNSILGVANRDYDAAAVANTVLKRMMTRGVVKPSQIKTIYRSATFPTTAYGTVYNLKPELQQKIQKAFMSYKWEGSKLAKEFGANGEEKFIPISFKDKWEVIRIIDKGNNVTYNCK